jgi:geranylgeranyl pyrophosphate synthase
MLLKSRAQEAEDIEEIRRLVVKYEGIDYALERAHTYAQRAKEALAAFEDSEDKETLELIADFVVDRDC